MTNHQNSVLLEGVLVTNPEVTATCRDGRRLIKFTLASDRYYLDKSDKSHKETVFIQVQCWGGLGEQCLSLMRKGMHARTVGRLMLCSWNSKVTGEKKSSIQIVCEHLEYQVKGTKGDVVKIGVLSDEDSEADTLSETVVLYEF